MHKQPADEVVVVVKQETDENMVTYLRIKLAESDDKEIVKGEGRDMLTVGIYALGTIITRSEDNLLRRHLRKDQPNQERSKK